MDRTTGHEVPLYPNVLLQKLPKHCENQQLYEFSELLSAKGNTIIYHLVTLSKFDFLQQSWILRWARRICERYKCPQL